MGIQGLLPFLKEIQRDVHVSSFRGRRVAVDGYCWLHRGAYSCALQLVMNTERLESLPFIKYCMKRVNMLLSYDITPVMVFDGGYLPLKEKTERERRERRQVNRERGKALLREGRKSEAVDCFQKSVDVSPEMAHALIKECRNAGVECIVAPYEADSQLAYLSKEQIVDLVITEDSDLLVFGCRKVMFKLDDSGNGKLIETEQLGKANRGLVGFTIDSFRHMCILSGCDYLASIPGIGLGKALKLMKKFNKDPYRVIKSLHYESGKVPKGYEEDFRKADQTFLYQLVFDPRTQQQTRLNPLPSDVDTTNFEFAGVTSSPRKAVGMARGNINPLSHVVMDTYSPSKAPPPSGVKLRSWGGSVMGGASGWGKLASAQPPSSSSSQSIMRHFKPPKKLKPRPEVTEEIDSVEDLTSSYLTATMPSTHNPTSPTTSPSTTTTTGPELPQRGATNGTELPQRGGEAGNSSPESTTTADTVKRESQVPPETSSGNSSTKSRFFSTLSSCEPSSSCVAGQTPSDTDVARMLRAKRKLSLMPRNPERHSDTGEGEEEKSDIELMAERCELRRKRLSCTDQREEEGRVRSTLQRFAYNVNPAAKKTKLSSSDSSAISQLDQISSPSSSSSVCVEAQKSSQCVTPSPVKNPFAKVGTTPSKKRCQFSYDEAATEEGVATSEEHKIVTDFGSFNSKILTHSQSTTLRDEMGRENGVGETVLQVRSDQQCPGATVPAGSFMTSEDYITTHSHTSLLGHIVSLSEGQNGCSSGHPLPPSKKRAMLGSNSRRRLSRGKCLPGSGSSVSSKFKAPKQSGSGLTQLNLLTQFSYSSHVKMSREQ